MSNHYNVFEWNNRAIASLQQGSDVVIGISAFRGALVRLRELLSKRDDYLGAMFKDEDTSKSSVTSNATRGSLLSSADICGASRSLMRCSYSATGIKQDDDNQFRIFERVFAIHLQHERSILTSVEIESLCSVTLLYNLGLCHQKKGLTNNSSQDLQLAAGLYHKAISLLNSIPCGYAENILLILALFNNLGHIFAHNFDLAQARSCLSVMKDIVESEESCDLEEDEYQFFSWPVFLHPEQSAPFAPAA